MYSFRQCDYYRIISLFHLVESATQISCISHVSFQKTISADRIQDRGLFLHDTQEEENRFHRQSGESKEKSKKKTEEKNLRLITANPHIMIAEQVPMFETQIKME